MNHEAIQDLGRLFKLCSDNRALLYSLASGIAGRSLEIDQESRYQLTELMKLDDYTCGVMLLRGWGVEIETQTKH